MAKAPEKGKKQVKTLRQATSEQDKPKKRSLKVPGRRLRQATDKKPRKDSRLRRIGRRIVPRYFRDSWKELQEVTWPNRRQTVKLTFAVIAFAAVFGIVIAIVDYGLDKVFRQLLLK